MAATEGERLLWFLTLTMLGSSQEHEPSVLAIDASALIQTDIKFQSTSSVNELDSLQPGTSIAPENRKIYTYWDYENGPSPWIELNVQSWLKHAPPGTEFVMVNESNFHSLIPDAPKELFKLPYAACKSDVVRAAVLYHHGGLYLDTDFVVMKPLSNIFAKLEQGFDVVAHSDMDGDSGQCVDNDFTSNFMAARKGNIVSGTWWENIKAKLTRTCDSGEYKKEKVCCHEAFADVEPEECHIPWGHLEWLKNPASDPDKEHYWNAKPKAPPKHVGSGPDVDSILAAIKRGNAKSKQLPRHARIFCLQGRDALQPHTNGAIYWQKWDSGAHATSADAAEASAKEYDLRFQCREKGRGDLYCNRGDWTGSDEDTEFNPNFRNFFGRTAYHLFFSTTTHHKKTAEDVLTSDYLAAELLRRSLEKRS